MTFRAPMIYVAVIMLAACSRGPMASASTDKPAASYVIVNEEQAGAMLRLDWKGEGRDLDSDKSIEVPEMDARRKTYVSINFMSSGPLLWRSNLERRLESGELKPGGMRTEPVGSSALVRATIVNERHSGEFFFKSGVGPDLDRSHYVAQCSMPLPIERGAVQCSTQLEVDTFAVKITFDRAFLWDFDNLSAEAVAAAKDHIAKPSTQRSIESIPRLNIP